MPLIYSTLLYICIYIYVTRWALICYKRNSSFFIFYISICILASRWASFIIVLLLREIVECAKLLVKLQILLSPYGPNSDKAVGTSTITTLLCLSYIYLTFSTDYTMQRYNSLSSKSLLFEILL
jgi:hypothetical protein